MLPKACLMVQSSRWVQHIGQFTPCDGAAAHLHITDPREPIHALAFTHKAEVDR